MALRYGEEASVRIGVRVRVRVRVITHRARGIASAVECGVSVTPFTHGWSIGIGIAIVAATVEGKRTGGGEEGRAEQGHEKKRGNGHGGNGETAGEAGCIRGQ